MGKERRIFDGSQNNAGDNLCALTESPTVESLGCARFVDVSHLEVPNRTISLVVFAYIIPTRTAC